MWFDSWSDVFRVLAIGTAAYVSLILVLRLSGKRTLAKLNAFDLVVTVALGSTLATILLSTEVALAEGVTALALLALLQFVVAWTTTKLPGGRSVVNARPSLVLRDGEVLHDRLTEGELTQAVRSSGNGSLASMAAVVLESDGTLSVIPAEKLGDGSALAQVEGMGASREEGRQRP